VAVAAHIRTIRHGKLIHEIFSMAVEEHGTKLNYYSPRKSSDKK
jgi:CRISPR/Cas system-associated exonuclease Cas4 (RecB family)